MDPIRIFHIDFGFMEEYGAVLPMAPRAASLDALATYIAKFFKTNSPSRARAIAADAVIARAAFDFEHTPAKHMGCPTQKLTAEEQREFLRLVRGRLVE